MHCVNVVFYFCVCCIYDSWFVRLFVPYTIYTFTCYTSEYTHTLTGCSQIVFVIQFMFRCLGWCVCCLTCHGGTPDFAVPSAITLIASGLFRRRGANCCCQHCRCLTLIKWAASEAQKKQRWKHSCCICAIGSQNSSRSNQNLQKCTYEKTKSVQQTACHFGQCEIYDFDNQPQRATPQRHPPGSTVLGLVRYASTN